MLQRVLSSRWFPPIFVFLLSLYTNLVYSFRRFEIVSDSVLEYEAYSLYALQGYWSSICNNMISSCLWTTYLPGVIQHFLRFPDSEFVYRAVLAVLVSFLPAVVFLVARRRASVLGASLMVTVLVTSFYYLGSVSYARIIVGATFVLLLLWVLVDCRGSKRLTLAVLFSAGVVTAYYTITYFYIVILSGLLVLSFLPLFRLDRVLLAVSLATLVLGAVFFYGRVPTIFYQVYSVATHVSVTAPVIDPSITIAHYLLWGRLVVMLVILIYILKAAKVMCPSIVLLGTYISASALSFALPGIDSAVGILRVGFLLTPLSIFGMREWIARVPQRYAVIPLVIGSVVYH